MSQVTWRPAFWLLISTVLVPTLITMCMGILILAFYEESWDVAAGLLVLSFAIFALVGGIITVFVLRRTAQLARLQAEFIARVSHDFRTPLTAIRLFVDTLRRGAVKSDQERDRCLELLSHETDRMEQLVERVLTWRRAEGKEVSRSATLCAMDDLAQHAVAPLRLDPQIDARLALSAEPRLPPVMADATSVVEAIRNLVDNAVKYCEEGPIVVSVRHDGNAVAVAVRDPGPPIPKKERRRIFKRFYRVDGSGKAGSGLGLAIVRQVARAHGGNLDLASSLAGGNVFTLSLPLARIDPNVPPHGDVDEPPPAGRTTAEDPEDAGEERRPEGTARAGR